MILSSNSMALRILAASLILLIFDSAAYAQDIIDCPQKPSRRKIDPHSMQIQWTGQQLSFSIGKAIHFEAGDTTLQKMHESVQVLNTILRTLTTQYNACLLDEEEYLKETNEAFKNAETGGERIKELAEKISNLEAMLDTQKKDKIHPQKALELINALKSSNEELRAKLGMYFQQTKTIQISFEGKFEQNHIRQLEENGKLREEIARLGQQNETLREDITKKVDENIGILSREIKELEERVATLENNVQFLMERYHSGQLDTTKLILGLSPAYARIDKESALSAFLTLEVLYPETHFLPSGWTPIVEIGILDWNKSDSYSTLPGLSAISFKQENGIIFFGGGVRKYFSLLDSFSPYIGVSAGYGQERESDGKNDFYFSSVLGIATYPFRIRTALELRYLNFAVSEKQIQFNLFGEASVARATHRQSAFSVSISFFLIVW